MSILDKKYIISWKEKTEMQTEKLEKGAPADNDADEAIFIAEHKASAFIKTS